MLRVRIVHRHDRVPERAVTGHRAQADDAGRGLLGPPQDLGDLLGPVLVEQAHHVAAVVHRDLRSSVEHRPDVTEVGFVVLALDRLRRHAGLAQRGRDIVLRRERIRGAERDVGPPGLQRQHQVRGLGRHVQARAHPNALERPLLLEPLADEREYRHLAVRPLDPLTSLLGQAQISYVAVHPSPFARTSSITEPTAPAIASEARTTSSCLTSTPTRFVTKNNPSTPAYTPRETGTPIRSAAENARPASTGSYAFTRSTNGGDPSGRRQPRSGLWPPEV